jgi:hypothetical protein
MEMCIYLCFFLLCNDFPPKYLALLSAHRVTNQQIIHIKNIYDHATYAESREVYIHPNPEPNPQTACRCVYDPSAGETSFESSAESRRLVIIYGVSPG